MFVYGMVDLGPGSPDPDEVVEQASDLLADGANGVALIGSRTGDPLVEPWETEWERWSDVVPAMATLGVPLSVATSHPDVARRSLGCGANVLDDPGGMMSEAMWEVGVDTDVQIVVRLATGAVVDIDALRSDVESRLAAADRHGLRHRCLLEVGLGPPTQVVAALDALRRFKLPLSFTLPRDLGDHDGLLDIVVERQLEFGRAYDPSQIRRAEQHLLG